MGRRRVWLALAGVAILIVAAVAYVAHRRDVMASPGGPSGSEFERLAVIERGELRFTVTLTGSVAPVGRYDLYFAQTGRVAELMVSEGDRVEAGQVLARLDTTELEAALRDAELELQLQELALDELLAGPDESEIEAAQAALDLALARYRQASQGPDPAQVEAARFSLEAARNSLWSEQLSNQAIMDSPGDYPAYMHDVARMSLEQAELSVSIAELELQQAQQGPDEAQVASAWASVVQAQANLDRLLAPPDPVDVRMAQERVTQARLAVELARHNLEGAALIAPVDGVVAAVNLAVGEDAPLGVPAVTLIDESGFFLDATVDEADVGCLALDQAATVIVDALPDLELSGRVTRIQPMAEVAGGVVSYRVRIDLDGDEVPLRAGMSAVADVLVRELDDVLLVPNWAVVRDRESGEFWVFVPGPDGEPMPVRVELGLRGELYSEVMGGLAEGDMVVAPPREGFSLTGGPPHR